MESDETFRVEVNSDINTQENGVHKFFVKKISKPMIAKLRPYLVALRPWSFTASFCPVALGAALHYKASSQFDLFIFIVTCICALSVHAAGNLVNTYYDYVRGIDSKKSDDRTLVDHILSPNDVSTMGAICYVFGCLGFLTLCQISPTPMPHLALLYFGGLSSSFLYTGGLGLKYLALGDILIFFTFGPLTVLFAFLAQGGQLSFFPLVHAIPLALNTEAILHANNARDIVMDKEAGIVTLAILIGKMWSHVLFVALLFVPYLIFVILGANFSPVFFIPIVTIFCAFPIERKFKNVENIQVKEVAKLNLLMSVCYILACLLVPQSSLPGRNL